MESGPSSRRRISEVIIEGHVEGRQDDPEWHRARLWADHAPALFDACSRAFIAWGKRKMDPNGMKEAVALLDEITHKLAHEVWLNGPWSLRQSHEESLKPVQAKAATALAAKSAAG